MKSRSYMLVIFYGVQCILRQIRAQVVKCPTRDHDGRGEDESPSKNYYRGENSPVILSLMRSMRNSA